MTDTPNDPLNRIADLVEGVGDDAAMPAEDGAPSPRPAALPAVTLVPERDDLLEDSSDDDIDDLNREYALVLMGSKAVVIREMPHAPVEYRSRVLSLDAFKVYLANRRLRRSRLVRDEKTGEVEEKITYHKVAPLWLVSRNRRSFDGIEFFPDPADAPGTKGFYNLWRGFAVKPALHVPHRDRVRLYATFYDHLRNNICGGIEATFQWVFGWMAHIVQRPRERTGTAIVLRGGEGWGKTKIGEVLGSLFPSHYFLVDDPRYLVGQFNAHMASCLLLQVDEGFWAGDKAAEGRLKGLVTAPVQMIEAKGVDPIRLDNFVRLMFSSNEDWVVPVGMDGRRFVVFDVSHRVARNAVYFGEMDRELNEGGREALLADLMEFDLSKVNLREVPKTTALLEQKLRSLDSVASWWFERLSDGNLTRRRTGWAGSDSGRGYVAVDTLFDDYVHVAEKVGVRRKSEKTSFGMRMRKLLEIDHVSMLQTTKRFVDVELSDNTTVRRRVPCYDMPSLADCRMAFEQACGQQVDWITEIDAAGKDGDAGAGERGDIRDDF